jgi:hypothetical protein
MKQPPSDDTSSRPLAAWIGLWLGVIIGGVVGLALMLLGKWSPPMAEAIGAGAVLGAALGWVFPRSMHLIGSVIFSLLA